MKLPNGFSATAVAAGIKPSGKTDLALVYADVPCAWAFVATRNRLTASCVSRNRVRYGTGEPIRAILVNSGNANCASGDSASFDNEEMARRAAGLLGDTKSHEVITASTGVIGVPLPMARVNEGLGRLTGERTDEVDAFAEAILTTDTKIKTVAANLRGGARMVGIAKGSGMIHPNMATMLAFVVTDARVSQEAMREMWPDVVERTFNQMTVDGDTSPNDMAILMSTQQIETPPSEFAEALQAVSTSLTEKIAADGEGASTMIRVRVMGARSEDEARLAARSVAGSSLVKAAVHGRDPNWGRILSAVGQTNVLWDSSRIEIIVQGTPVYRGEPLDFDAEAVSTSLDNTIVEFEIDLGAGPSTGRAWGCDLTEGYVKINADYTT